MEFTRQLLETIGLESQRLQMINLSAAMGGQFAFAAAEITADIQQLGPNPMRGNTPIPSQQTTSAGVSESLKVEDGSIE